MDNPEIFFAILGIALMLVGILLSLFFSRRDPRYARAVGVFVIGAAILLINFLYYNPDILENIEKNFALVLLSIVFVFVQLIRRK